MDIKGSGTVALISYLRTDSTRVSEEAAKAARDYISSNYGETYVSAGHNTKTSGKKIQDAHEAIRPTDLSRTPATVKDSLTREQFRLYQLIWKRFAASQMADAVYETSSVKVDGGKYRFTMSASRDYLRRLYVRLCTGRGKGRGQPSAEGAEQGNEAVLEGI